jgi:hypothetical protein
MSELNGHTPHPNGDALRVLGLAVGPLEPRSDGGSHTSAVANNDPQTGRFVAGNRAAKGNPHARRMASVRQAFADAISENDIKQLARKLYQRAVDGGDIAAAQLVLGFVCGKPGPTPDPDRLDQDEFAILDAWPTVAQVMRGLLDSADPAQATEYLKNVIAKARDLRKDTRRADRDQLRDVQGLRRERAGKSPRK